MQIKDFVALAKTWEAHSEYEQLKEAEIFFVITDTPKPRIRPIASNAVSHLKQDLSVVPQIRRRRVYFFGSGEWRDAEPDEFNDPAP